MALEIKVNIGSGNGLLPTGHKPLPKASPLAYDQWGSVAMHFHRRVQDISP